MDITDHIQGTCRRRKHVSSLPNPLRNLHTGFTGLRRTPLSKQETTVGGSEADGAADLVNILSGSSSLEERGFTNSEFEL